MLLRDNTCFCLILLFSPLDNSDFLKFCIFKLCLELGGGLLFEKFDCKTFNFQYLQFSHFRLHKIPFSLIVLHFFGIVLLMIEPAISQLTKNELLDI